MHDHCYSLPPGAEECSDKYRVDNTQSIVSGSDLPSFHMDEEFRTLCTEVKVALNASPDEHARIEVNTQKQSLQQDWHVQRSKRITGSKCLKIFCQKMRSVSLLQ